MDEDGREQAADPNSPLSWTQERLDAHCRKLVKELQDSMSRCDAFDVLANLWFLNIPINPDKYTEGEHGGLQARVEYAGELLRHRPDRTGSDSERLPIPHPLAKDWNDKIDALFTYRLIGASGRGKERNAAADELTRVQGSLTIQEFVIRARAFDHQEVQTVGELLSGPVSADLVELVGFDGRDALRLLDAIQTIEADRWDSWRSQTRAYVDRLKDDLDRTGRGEASSSEFSPEVLERMRNANADESKLGDFVIAHTWAGIGSRVQLAAGEVAGRAGVDRAVADAFLKYFSVPFVSDGEPEFPQVNGVLRTRPLIRDDAGSYFCVCSGSLLWALRSRLERTLKPGSAGEAVWQRYQSHRAGVVERRAVSALQKALRAPAALRNVGYSFGGRRYEVDGLVIVDSLVTIIEAKSATMRASSRQGDADHLAEDLNDLVGRVETISQ